MKLYYLIENTDGFEVPISVGTRKELAIQEKMLLAEKTLLPVVEESLGWVIAKYYLVSKEEWDSEHCPLIPVDFS